jgi:hypothetical protein
LQPNGNAKCNELTRVKVEEDEDFDRVTESFTFLSITLGPYRGTLKFNVLLNE